jgi:4-hydroxybenzoate polyprenyltransferase
VTERLFDPLEATPTRRALHHFLGPALPWLLHLRPAEWPVMAGHTALGWLLAAGWRAPDGTAMLGLAAWVVCLNGGTLALNSAFDRDEGDVAYLRRPPRPPRGLAAGAMILMLAGLALTWTFPAPWPWLYGACVLMSIAYSMPPLRLKAVGGADWLINMVGFGILTPWAGWAITGRPLSLPDALLLGAFGPLFAAFYPLTQLYQMDEDRARGDQTMVIRLGARRALAVALVAAALAFAMIAAAAVLAEWTTDGWLRWASLGVAVLAWIAVLVPWYQDGAGWSTREHQRGMYHALGAWALTDAAVLIAWLGA